MRYTTECTRCHELMQPGALAVRYLGGLWHPECLLNYRRSRGLMEAVATLRLAR